MASIVYPALILYKASGTTPTEATSVIAFPQKVAVPPQAKATVGRKKSTLKPCFDDIFKNYQILEQFCCQIKLVY